MNKELQQILSSYCDLDTLEEKLTDYFGKKLYPNLSNFIKYPHLSYRDFMWLSEERNVEYLKVMHEFYKLGFTPEGTRELIRAMTGK